MLSDDVFPPRFFHALDFIGLPIECIIYPPAKRGVRSFWQVKLAGRKVAQCIIKVDFQPDTIKAGF